MNSGIYCIENLVNGKMYFGQSSNLKRRKRNHFGKLKTGKSKLRKLQNAFNKYGKDYFIFTVVEYCDESLLDEREIEWIKTFETKEKGYNCTEGGKRGRFCQETKTKMSKNSAKTGLGLFGRDSKKSKRVYQYNLKGDFVKEWGAVIEVAKFFSVHERQISRCACGKRPRWKEHLFFYEFKGNKIEPYNKKIVQYNLPIYQYDLDGNFIREWKSSLDASKCVGCKNVTLRACLCGSNTTSCGYVWKRQFEGNKIEVMLKKNKSYLMNRLKNRKINDLEIYNIT